MLVVADASPLIVLATIGQIQILPTLYGQVIIPPEVSAELRSPNRSQAVRDFFSSDFEWLVVQSPQSRETIPFLHRGETAAIHLARELHADLLLIDESRGRRAAVARSVQISGTVGVLEIAASRNLLDLAEAFTRIKQTDFWISHTLLDRRLEEHLKRRQP